MESRRVSLATKPGASLYISVYSPTDPARLSATLASTLIVFLNGLMSPQSSWKAAIDTLLEKHKDSVPALLTYDRFGQGDSDPDPSDPQDTPYGHDAAAVIDDLHQLLVQVCSGVLHLDLPGQGNDTRLVLVANSIGCPLARLYVAAHPATVAGFLFLDSMMANTDFVSLFPNPDGPEFDPSKLPEGISTQDVRHARQQYEKFFHPMVPNPEHFDRRDLRERLPAADKPMLPAGPDARDPVLTVAGHDWDVFAQNSLEVSQHQPAALRA
jgi:pimeloyl-ACP methyl ester carboxylesterase